jgi:DNA-directed RNA polymerase subunit F
MNRLTKFGLTALLCAAFLLSDSAFAQRPAHPVPANQKNTAHPRPDRAHPGKWLREHANLPPQEQEKALEKDPDYQNLPAQRQEQLKEHLRRFNNLPPEQRERMINRMEKIEQLPPDKRQLLQQSMSQLAFLPQDRRQMVRKAYRNLREMSPEERDRVMNSDQFKNTLNENERSILSGLLQSGVDLGGGQAGAQSPGSSAPPK